MAMATKRNRESYEASIDASFFEISILITMRNMHTMVNQDVHDMINTLSIINYIMEGINRSESRERKYKNIAISFISQLGYDDVHHHKSEFYPNGGEVEIILDSYSDELGEPAGDRVYQFMNDFELKHSRAFATLPEDVSVTIRISSGPDYTSCVTLRF